MSDPKSRSTFCPVPFIQLQLNHRGKVSACCYSGEYNLGDVNVDKIEDIWNGEKIQAWRNEMITGELNICKKPIAEIKCHLFHQKFSPLVDLNVIQKNGPIKLDLRLNGKCNLECIMCDVWQEPDGPYDRSDFWTYGETHIFPYLEEVYMLGGEPFIQRDTFRLIDKVLETNKTCTWSFFTNCSYTFNSAIRTYLDKIKLLQINLSLDAITAPTYEQVRLKGNFKKTMNTVHGFIQYRNEKADQGIYFDLFASMCVQKLNWREIPEFLDFCEQHKLRGFLQPMNGFPEHNIDALSKAELLDLRVLLEPMISDHRKGNAFPIYNHVQEILEKI